jgi:hypothetical protein
MENKKKPLVISLNYDGLALLPSIDDAMKAVEDGVKYMGQMRDHDVSTWAMSIWPSDILSRRSVQIPQA